MRDEDLERRGGEVAREGGHGDVLFLVAVNADLVLAIEVEELVRRLEGNDAQLDGSQPQKRGRKRTVRNGSGLEGAGEAAIDDGEGDGMEALGSFVSRASVRERFLGRGFLSAIRRWPVSEAEKTKSGGVRRGRRRRIRPWFASR